MGIVDDILKGLPVNPLLREKVAELEAKHAALETENAILKDDLRDAKAEVTKLRNQIDKLTHKDTPLEEDERQLLIAVAQCPHPYPAEIARQLNIPFERARYFLQRLEEASYIHYTSGGKCLLTQKGRALLVAEGIL